MSAFNPQDQMRQQQEMMRKQQEDGRRRMQMGAWAQQQREQVAGTDAFAHVEKEAAWLRQERAAGRLTEDDLKARLKELMFQDSDGVWWMVGQQSGEWYRNEGGHWVRAKPAVGAAISHGVVNVAGSSAARKGHRSLGAAVLVLGLAASLVLGMTTFPHRVLAPMIGFALGPNEMIWLVWILGAIVTVLIARKISRG